MPYLEGALQDAFVSWYKNQTGYQQTFFDDSTATGTSVDSVGFVGSTPILIEFKHRIDPNQVYYEDRHGGSLEDKIARALASLCQRRSDYISDALGTWDGHSLPLVLIVANVMSDDGRQQVCDMLVSRARKWGFRPQVWQWTGSEGVLVFELDDEDIALLDCSQLMLPEMPYIPHQREKPRTLEEFRSVAADRGVAELLDAFCEEARLRGGRLSRNSINFNYRFRDLETRKLVTIVGTWPFDNCSGRGLVVSYWSEAFGQCFGTASVPDHELPGIETTRRGHLGPSRCLHTIEEVQHFWELLAGEKSQ